MTTKVYQLKIHLEKVSPMIWRRLLVEDTTTIAQLHCIFQLVMGWENIHLHCFRIYGKDYGIYYLGGMSFSNDPKKVQLKDFNFRINDKFYYDYNFNVNWKHQIRVEKILDYDEKQQYPYCLAGKNACPPEQVRGVEDFLEVRDLFKIPLYELVAILKVQDYFGYNWHPDIFKKRKINKWLKTEDYDYLGQNDPLFPDRTSGYFKDDYWKINDETFNTAKQVYLILKEQGIQAKSGLDALVKYLEPYMKKKE